MFQWIKNLYNLFMAKRSATGKLGKAWWRSKTLWVNILALVVLLFKDQLGLTISGEETTAIMAVINMILRFITNEPVGFKNK